MRAKWERLYKAEGGAAPPWCSGKPSTHLAKFLQSGSVVGVGVGGAPASVQPTSGHRSSNGTVAGDALDVGCGSNGANVALLASHGYRAAGVDFVDEAIRRAREMAAAEVAAAAGGRRGTAAASAAAFAACDVMTARLASWHDVLTMEVQEQSRQAKLPFIPLPVLPPPAEGSRGGFWLLFDCQCWHVLRLEVNSSSGSRGCAVSARYRQLLQPGGVLVVLCGRREEGGGNGDTGRRTDGPNEVSLAELRRAFSLEVGWIEREVVATHFDPTTAYERRPGGPPPAWAAVFEAT